MSSDLLRELIIKKLNYGNENLLCSCLSSSTVTLRSPSRDRDLVSNSGVVVVSGSDARSSDADDAATVVLFVDNAAGFGGNTGFIDVFCFGRLSFDIHAAICSADPYGD